MSMHVRARLNRPRRWSSTLILLMMPFTGDRSSVRRTLSRADFIDSSRTARSPRGLGQIFFRLCPERGAHRWRCAICFCELAAHVGCLAVETQHFDFGDDLLCVEAPRNIQLFVEKLQRFGQPLLLLE